MNNIKIRALVAFEQKEPYNSLVNIVYNLVRNQFTVSETGDNKNVLPYEDVVHQFYTTRGMPSFPIIWYAWKNGASIKIVLDRTEKGSSVTIYPITPFKMQEEHGRKNQDIDLAFYIQCCIEICENFLVFDLVSLEE
jgi:hypothetical protein